MKFIFKFVKTTPLCIALAKKNNQIAKLLISRPEIDVNKMSILFKY